MVNLLYCQFDILMGKLTIEAKDLHSNKEINKVKRLSYKNRSANKNNSIKALRKQKNSKSQNKNNKWRKIQEKITRKNNQYKISRKEFMLPNSHQYTHMSLTTLILLMGLQLERHELYHQLSLCNSKFLEWKIFHKRTLYRLMRRKLYLQCKANITSIFHSKT